MTINTKSLPPKRNIPIYPPLIFFVRLTRELQLMAGMCAAKALVQHLCKRLNDSDFLHVFILIA